MSTRDLKGVLAFVSDAHDVDGLNALPTQLLDRLGELVGCEYVTYEAYDWPRRVATALLPCSNQCQLEGPPSQPSEDFWEGGCHDFWTGAAIDKMSDRFGRRGRERLFKEEEHFEGFFIVDRLSLHVGDPQTQSAWLGFDSTARDFDERDRELALVLRPHFATLWRRSAARQQIVELLAALERDGDTLPPAIVLLERDGRIAHATAEAQRLLGGWFGTRNGGLPLELHEWISRAGVGERYVECRNGSTLTVEVAGDLALMLREQQSQSARLTPRELEVLSLVGEGLTNAEIAERLWVAQSTVAKHLEQAYRKLGVRSRTAAVARLRDPRRALET